ncbi:11184_t:CDS:2, partial [Rhizophagus irregularis]
IRVANNSPKRNFLLIIDTVEKWMNYYDYYASCTVTNKVKINKSQKGFE